MIEMTQLRVEPHRRIVLRGQQGALPQEFAGLFVRYVAASPTPTSIRTSTSLGRFEDRSGGNDDDDEEENGIGDAR
jgi:hypothetical protein